MWIVISMSNNKNIADNMQRTLEAEGILVKVRNVSAKTKRNGNTFEVLVLESESDSAKEILFENGL